MKKRFISVVAGVSALFLLSGCVAEKNNVDTKKSIHSYSNNYEIILSQYDEVYQMKEKLVNLELSTKVIDESLRDNVITNEEFLKIERNYDAQIDYFEKNLVKDKIIKLKQ